MRATLHIVGPFVLIAAVTGWAFHVIAQPDQSFRARIEQLSEPGGDFDTDNLISNEGSYLDVVPALRAAGVQGGVYIGVGPDQNFSYIAHVRPDVAFIVDIRRDNMLLHLLFKALFALAPSRVEYLCLLTGRAVPQPVDAWRDASLPRIVTYLDAAKPAGEPQDLERKLHDAIARFGVALTPADFSAIARFHAAFVGAGLSLKFESHGRLPRSAYPTYRDLLLTSDQQGQLDNFLSDDSSYRFVRTLQARDRVVPVVGDLGGMHTLSAIADYMTQHGDHLSAFYISNVETYLYGDKYQQFVENVRRLPRDEHSVIIRSLFRASVSRSELQPVNAFVAQNR